MQRATQGLFSTEGAFLKVVFERVRLPCQRTQAVTVASVISFSNSCLRVLYVSPSYTPAMPLYSRASKSLLTSSVLLLRT